MYFEAFKTILYSDTLVPDVFISEYLPSLSSDSIKVYIYCLFLSKHDKHSSVPEIAKSLDMDTNSVKTALILLESLGVVNKRDDGTLLFIDLKEKEINKLYRPKLTSSPEEALQSSEKNKKRNTIISAINNAFFQGVMPPSWYTDIDAWFDKYRFEEDVMYSLFQHCYDHNGMSKNYIIKVADSWHSKKIINAFDLDRYFIEYQKLREIKVNIAKKLKFNRMLTEYEQLYVEKWVIDFGYDFEIIEIALKRTTTKTNPSLEFVNTVLTDWHKNGLKTKEAINEYLLSKKSTSKQAVKGPAVPQHGNFKQREYDDEYYESLYEKT